MEFRLKEILHESKMSMEKLSLESGVSRNTISLLSNGKSQGIKFNTLYRIANVLNVSIGELFEQEKYKEIYEKAKKYDAIKNVILNTEDK